MMDEINFPIVYTVKPISCLNWKDYGRVIGYAVVEAYLISEVKRYKTDGSYDYLYEVVYTWNEDGRENIIPLFKENISSTIFLSLTSLIFLNLVLENIIYLLEVIELYTDRSILFNP